MTVTRNGVRFTRRSNRWWRLAFILAAEGVLSAFVYMSLAAHVLWPEDSRAATGVSAMLSYEGRLMDASGNPLGGTGTPYCFRYSIYDAPSGGTKLWPSGTPNTSLATSTDGVFSSLIGQADALTYNFFDSDTVYLNVDVYTAAASGGTCSGGSWESLTPRQQIASTGYAQTAKNTYGGSIQVGDGAGVTLNYLALDVKNTDDYIGQSCTTSGTVWYNSAISKTLVCENSVIQAISNASATTTIAGITTNTAAAASTGTIVFSNANGVTFGINGQTITASVAAGGGNPPADLYMFDNLNRREFITNVTNMTATGVTQRPLFIPFRLDGSLTFNNIALEVSRATSGSNLFTAQAAIYTFVNSTQISRLASLQNTFSATATASISGVRQLRLTGLEAAGSTLSPGNYVMMLYFSAANTASMNYSLRGGQTVGPPAGNIFPGANSQITATSQLSSIYLDQFRGRYTATTASPPASVNLTQVQGWTSIAPIYFRLFST